MNEILRQKLEEMADSAITEGFLREAWTDKTEEIPKYADALGYIKPREDDKIAKQVRDDDSHEADVADVEPDSHGDKSKQTGKKSPGNKNNTPASLSKEKYRSDASTPKNPLVVIGQGPKPMLDPDEVEDEMEEGVVSAVVSAVTGKPDTSNLQLKHNPSVGMKLPAKNLPSPEHHKNAVNYLQNALTGPKSNTINKNAVKTLITHHSEKAGIKTKKPAPFKVADTSGFARKGVDLAHQILRSSNVVISEKLHMEKSGKRPLSNVDHLSLGDQYRHHIAAARFYSGSDPDKIHPDEYDARIEKYHHHKGKLGDIENKIKFEDPSRPTGGSNKISRDSNHDQAGLHIAYYQNHLEPLKKLNSKLKAIVDSGKGLSAHVRTLKKNEDGISRLKNEIKYWEEKQK